MKNLITAIALVASLAIGASANAQQQRLKVIQPQTQAYINPGIPHHFDCARLGFHGHFIPGFGMKIISVNPHGKAARLGLEPGDAIKRINGVLVSSEFQYKILLNNAIKYEHGHVDLLVRNVRWDWGHPVPKFVKVHTYLSCGYHHH